MRWRSEGGSVGLLTLPIRCTADDLLASCRLATKLNPASTLNVAGITAGRWGALIRAGLLFEIISGYTVVGERGTGIGEKMLETWCNVHTAHSG